MSYRPAECGAGRLIGITDGIPARYGLKWFIRSVNGHALRHWRLLSIGVTPHWPRTHYIEKCSRCVIARSGERAMGRRCDLTFSTRNDLRPQQ